MYGFDNCIVQAKVDKDSKFFLKKQANNMYLSVAELSGSIIRKFIYEFSKGSNEYTNLEKFVIKDGKIKGGSHAL